MKAWKNFLLVLLTLSLAPMAMTAVDQYRERQVLEEELAHRKAVACPLELRGQQLIANKLEAHNLFRARTTVLECYYRKGVEG